MKTPLCYGRIQAAAGPDATLPTHAEASLLSAWTARVRMSSDSCALLSACVTTIRNFDALNDVQNLIFSGKCIVEVGLRHEIAITMMDLPPGSPATHTSEFYLGVLRQVLDADIPYHSLCFKDATGTARPRMVYETIKAARKLLGQDARIVFHTHETAGTGTLCYTSAIEAGADQVDLSIAPLSGGTCQPDIVTLWHALRGSDYTLDIDIHKIIMLEEMLKEALADYILLPEATRVEPLIPFFPMPGGALTANNRCFAIQHADNIRSCRRNGRSGGERWFRHGSDAVSSLCSQAYNNVAMPWKRISRATGNGA